MRSQLSDLMQVLRHEASCLFSRGLSRFDVGASSVHDHIQCATSLVVLILILILVAEDKLQI